MPKKRHSNLYTKPPSTVHHAPSSSAAASSAVNRARENVASQSVNELLASLRRSQAQPINPSDIPAITPSMPGQIRQILALPEMPPPRPRVKHRVELDHLPGIVKWPRPRSLKESVLKQLARDWDYHLEYDQHWLATLPTSLRVVLLSYLAYRGPENGITLEGLNRVLVPTSNSIDFGGNDDFDRLDLSRSIGRSVQLKSLPDMLSTSSKGVAEEETTEEDWDVSSPLHVVVPSTKISNLRYLSLASPSKASNPWPALLRIVSNLSALTHLSLAHWPKPQLTPNSQTASVISAHGRPVNYGATGFYAHTIDNDWSEAAGIMRRLSMSLYGLEWLDLDGCYPWFKALMYRGPSEPGIDWSTKWNGIRTLQLRSRLADLDILTYATHDDLGAGPHPPPRFVTDVVKYKQRIVITMEVERHIRAQRRIRGGAENAWTDVLRDDFKKYDNVLDEQKSVVDRQVEIAAGDAVLADLGRQEQFTASWD